MPRRYEVNIYNKIVEEKQPDGMTFIIHSLNLKKNGPFYVEIIKDGYTMVHTKEFTEMPSQQAIDEFKAETDEKYYKNICILL